MSMRPLPIQFRVYPDKIRKRNSKGKSRVPINWTLTFDTETTTDETQRLLFGFAQLRTVRQDDNGVPDKTVCVREICFYADDLPDFRPATYQALQNYTKDVSFKDDNRNANTRLTYPWRYDNDHGQLDVEPRRNIIFIPASKFVEDYLLNCGYADVRTKDQWYQPATITGFNLSFDMWRLVSRVITDQRGWHYGGLGGEFLTGKAWAPTYGEYPMGIGMNRWFTYTNRRNQSQKDGKPPAYLVDLAQLGMALTARKQNLLSTGKAFGCQTLKYAGKEIHDPEENYHGTNGWEQLYHYINYARNDVNATAELWEKESIRFYSHPIDLLPSDTYSPASISKGYFRAMGIHPTLCGCPICMRRKRGGHKVPKQVLGLAMGGFFGGRSECKIRMLSLPAVLLDFVSMYPLIMILAGIWELLTAERIECREETEQVQALLDNLTMDDLRNPEMWRQLCGIAEFKPDEDIVPVRTPYVDTSKLANKKVTASAANIGINHFTAIRNTSYALYDVAASIILSDKKPQIHKAWRFYPVGKQSTLKPVKFMGNDELLFDPNEENLFKWLITQRKIIAKRHFDYQDVETDLFTEQAQILNSGPFDLVYEQQKWLRKHVLCRSVQLCGHCQRVLDHHRAMLIASEPGYEWAKEDLAQDSYQEALRVDDFQMREAHESNNDNSGTWNENTDECLCDACIQKQFIKIFANAIYGIFAETNTNTRAGKTRSDVYGLEGESFKPANPEEPGEFCFPVFSTIITAGARLMLTLVEKMVTDLGSQMVFCDTDSACIPATKDGDTTDGVKLLTYEQVDQIREWFRPLNPYDENIVPDLLDWQYPKRKGDAYPDQPVYVTAISAKRYAIYNIVNGEPILIRVIDDDETDADSESDAETVSTDDVAIIKRSEHGLGLYVNPLSQQQRNVTDENEISKPDWIGEAWVYMIKRHVFSQDIPEPSWFDLPAVSRFPVKTKHVYETFKDYNSGKSIDWQVRPYNFYLAYHLNRWGQAQRPSMRLIAPFSDDPASWPELEVIDIHTRKRYRVTTDSESTDPNRLYVKTYRDVINEYVTHPEYKFDDSAGNMCGMHTRGVLQRTHVLMTGTEYITKDATSLSTDAESFTDTGPRVYKTDETLGTYRIAIEVIREHGINGKQLAAIAKVDSTSGQRYMKRKQAPGAAVMNRIIDHAAGLVRDEINDKSLRRSHQILGMWKHRKDKARKNETKASPL